LSSVDYYASKEEDIHLPDKPVLADAGIGESSARFLYKKKGVEMTPFWAENREDMDFQTLQKYFDLESLIG
jgi:hypothetical protein